MSERLRGQLAAVVFDAIDDPDGTKSSGIVAEQLRTLSELGYTIVPTDRWERLLAFGIKWFAEEFDDCDEWRNWRDAKLKPGDLDPLAIVPVAPDAGRVETQVSPNVASGTKSTPGEGTNLT